MLSSSMLVVVLVCITAALMVRKTEGARAFFVFGDSLVDNGNNNFLVTTARADVPPYGVDYPTHHPTGRFSNGYNIPDIISMLSSSCKLNPELHGKKLLVGANFASAGVGILNDTGYQFVNIIRIHKQLDYFEKYQCRVTELIGEEAKTKLVKDGLVLFSIGSNDFVNNYYLTPVTMRRVQYSNQRVYNLGARRVLVMGVGPLGCVPAMLATRSKDGNCATEVQIASSIFNQQLVEMISGLNQDVGSNVFVAVNAGKMQNDFIDNPHEYGFVTSKVACCGQGPYNGVGLCTEASHLCNERDKYAFWDAFHPTEKANRIIVRTILTGSSAYMMPMNLSAIMQLDAAAEDGIRF